MGSINSLIILLSYAITLCGMIPLYPWLETAPRLIFAAGLIAGVWQDRRGAWPIKEWMFNTAILPVFLFYALQFTKSNPLQPVVSMLAIMLAARLAGSKTGRHYLQTAVLSLFCLSSSSLFDLSPVFLVYLGLMLFLVALLLVLLTFHGQEQGLLLTGPELRKVLAAGLLMPLASLPLLVFFFPVLPRTQLPLWNFQNAPVSRTSGFSDVVEPGTSSSQGSSRTLAFRVEMPRQSHQQLYWRGTVLNVIEGRRWSRSPAPSEQVVQSGPRIPQMFFPEPGVSRYLPTLDAPVALELRNSRRLPDTVYEYTGSIGKRFTYTAESVSSGRLIAVKVIKRPFYLTLPSRLPQRIRQLADTIRSQGSTDQERLERLETYFRNGSFRYSRTGLPTGEDALEKFLFESRQGHCEFFASAFALVLRAAGVPARLVGGYLGGEYNQLGGYYQVTDDMAHVWVEVFIDGQGWLRVDPSSYASNSDTVWAPPRRSLLMKIRMTLDSLDHTWNRAVITYDFERQFNAARSVGSRLQGFDMKRALKSLKPYLITAGGLALISMLAVYRRRLFPGRNERLLRAFYRRVERDCGVKAERGRVGLFELARSTGNPKIQQFANIYGGAVYRDRSLSDQEYNELIALIKCGFK